MKSYFTKPASQNIVLFAFLGIFASILGLNIIPGVFSLDEVNHSYAVAALKQGGVELEEMQNYPERKALRYFIPGAEMSTEEPARIVSNAPPLYPFFALPFAHAGGFYGLIWLNILAFILCAWMVFAYTHQFSSHPSEPWVALLLFTLGAYTIEYSLGVWPHCLSAALCMGGFFLAAKGRQTTTHTGRHHVCSGLLLGLAMGIRYPNVVFAAAVLLSVLLLSPHKKTALLYCILGITPPVLLSSYVNYLRQDSWNPFSKGPTYSILPLVSGVTRGRPLQGLTFAVHAFFSRVFDFSLQGDLPVGFAPSPSSEAGAIFAMGVLKKAWIQSIPWVLPVLVLLLITFILPRNWRQTERKRDREMIAIALVVFSILFLYTAAGPRRFDGLSFNQRYFFDLLPLAAVAFAWAVGKRLWQNPHLTGLGLLGGALPAILILQRQAGTFWRDLLLLYVPIILSIALLILWPAKKKFLATLVPILASAAIAWSSTVHLHDDIYGSRKMRHHQAQRLAEAFEVLPVNDPALLLTYHGLSVALGPLQLTRDVHIADLWIDRGGSAPSLIDTALRKNRRVFIILNDFPEPVITPILEMHQTQWLHRGNLGILEIILKNTNVSSSSAKELTTSPMSYLFSHKT
jgi:hypothetical protein